MHEKVLVTGACGFVGFHCVEWLAENGYDIYATDVPSSDTRALKNFPATFFHADLTNKETLQKIPLDVDFVFHTAAIFHFSTPWEKIARVNVEGTRNLLEVLKNQSLKRFVNWSTTGVYGLPGKNVRVVDENTPPAPSNNYEKSKWMQEEVAREYAEKYNIPVTVIRPAPIYGPRSKYGMGQLIQLVAKGHLQCSTIFAKTPFPTVHVKDVCRAALFLSQKEEARNEAYTLVDDQTLTVEEMAYVIGKEVGTKIFQLHIPLPLIKFLGVMTSRWSSFEAKYILKTKVPKVERDALLYLTATSRYSNGKIKKLGYDFLYPDARAGLIETIAWYKKEGWVQCPE